MKKIVIAIVLAATTYQAQCLAAGVPSPSSPEQRELADQWARWLKESLDYCGANERCKNVVNRSFANNFQCAQGDHLACDERARDVADWSSQRNVQPQAPQASPQDTLLKCLQNTAARVVTSCRNTGCDTSLLYDIIGEAQKMYCGYSAIEPIRAPTLGPNPTPNPTTCFTDPTPSGGWSTTCM